MVKPEVDLLFPCLEVRYNPKEEYYVLVHPLPKTVEMVANTSSRFVVEDFWVFTQLIGGVGEWAISIEIRNEAGLRVARSGAQRAEFETIERLYGRQFAFCLKNVLFNNPGQYEVVLLLGELDVAKSYLRVLEGWGA